MRHSAGAWSGKTSEVPRIPFFAKDWDAFSAGPHKRKGPLCRGPSQFKVAGKGIEPLTRGFSVLCSTN